jgi:hypothetical protein
MALDLTAICLANLINADNYGTEMEELFDEPNEYYSSKFEVIESFLTQLVEEWTNRGVDIQSVQSVQSVLIPTEFLNEIQQHQLRGCNCADRRLQQLLALFPNAIIQYT